MTDSAAESLAPATKIALLERAIAAYRLDAGLALHRAVEAELARAAVVAGPVLEIGCDDGVFTALIATSPGGVERIGCDLAASGLARARRGGLYLAVVQGDATCLPFTSAAFGSVVCNSVLTHVENLPAALTELRRVLRPGGRLWATVPAPDFHARRFPVPLWRVCGLARMARRNALAYDRHWQQRHLLDVADWTNRLARAGFALEQARGYLGGAGGLVWSSLFALYRLGRGRLTLGALLRRLLPADTARARHAAAWLARRLLRWADSAAGASAGSLCLIARAA